MQTLYTIICLSIYKNNIKYWAKWNLVELKVQKKEK